MNIKIYYIDPSDANGNHDKSLLCPTNIVYSRAEMRFKHVFACAISSIAENNQIKKYLVYKAELVDDEGNVLYIRVGLPLEVKYINLTK